MSFRELMNDRVSLIKPSGERYDNIVASVQTKMVFIDDAKLPIEEGDIIRRQLPNGLEERFEVTDRGFQSGTHGIPAHYQVKVRKLTAVDTRLPRQVVYNVTGPNARVNVNSTDSSLNVVNVAPDALFREIRGALEATVNAQTQTLLAKLGDLEKARDSRGYLAAYQQFIAAAADHMTIVAPFLPALAQLLPK